MRPPSLRVYLWGSATAIGPHFLGKGLRQDAYQLVLGKNKTRNYHPLPSTRNMSQKARAGGGGGWEEDGRKTALSESWSSWIKVQIWEPEGGLS